MSSVALKAELYHKNIALCWDVGNHGLCLVSCLKNHVIDFHVKVYGSWGTVYLTVTDKLRYSLILGSEAFSLLCDSLCSLEISEAYRGLTGQLV